jgi:hypothetical protein
VLLGKMAASLDHISNGRLYLGVGAGWKEAEYNAYNIPFPKTMTRIRQLDETLEICKRMFTDPKADFQGKYYSVNQCVAMPKPVQNPLPVVIGGTGYNTLKVTAKHAHIANFAWNTPIETFDEKLHVLEKHCKKIGRDYSEIRKSAGLTHKIKGINPIMPAPYTKYTGNTQRNGKTVDEATEFINEYLDLGVNHVVIMFPYGEEKESITRLMDEIVPNLKS